MPIVTPASPRPTAQLMRMSNTRYGTEDMKVDQARNNRVDARATDRRGDRQQQRDDRGRHRRHETNRKRGRETGDGACEHIPTELIRAEGVLERRRKHLLRKIGDLRDVMDQTATNHNA